MALTNNNYLEVLFKVTDEQLVDKTESEISNIKSIIKSLINAEKEYEFNDERPKIKALLDSLIHD